MGAAAPAIMAVSSVASVGIGMMGQRAAARDAAAASAHAMQAGKQAAEHQRIVADLNANHQLFGAEQAEIQARWQKEYSIQQAAYQRALAYNQAGIMQQRGTLEVQRLLRIQAQQNAYRESVISSVRRAQDFEDRRVMAIRAAEEQKINLLDQQAHFVLDQARLTAEDIIAEGKIQHDLIYRERAIEEKVRQNEIAQTFKQEGRVGGEIMAGLAASGVDPLSGSGVDLLLEAVNEFDEQREAINENSLTKKETIELRAQMAERQAIANATNVVRQGAMQAVDYHAQKYAHLSNMYTTRAKDFTDRIDALAALPQDHMDFSNLYNMRSAAYTTMLQGDRAAHETLYRGELAAYDSKVQAFNLYHQAQRTKYYGELDAQRSEYAGLSAAAGYSAQAAQYKNAAIGSLISGAGQIAQTFSKFSAAAPAGIIPTTPAQTAGMWSIY